MNILITNFHSIKNKGDLGIVLGLLRRLREEYPQAQVRIIGREVSERPWWEAQGIQFFLPLLDYGSKKPRKAPPSPIVARLWAFWFFCEYYLTLGFISSVKLSRSYYRNSPERLATLEAYRWSDIIISKGGSFFREPEYRMNILPIGIFRHLHQLMVGYRLKKKVILSAQSFGPISNPFTRWILRRAFSRFSLVTARDSDSKLFLDRYLTRQKPSLHVGDSAFFMQARNLASPSYLEAVHPIQIVKQMGKHCVGITVRAWSHKEEYQRYIQAFADLITSEMDYTFVLMPQVTGPSKSEDDRSVSKQVLALVPESCHARVILIEAELEPAELIAIYNQMDFFIATRLHSAIFALVAERPVLAIGYEPKTIGIFSDLHLKDQVLDIRSLSSGSLKQAFARLKDIPRARFSQALDQARILAEQNIQAIRQIIDL